MDRKQKLIWIVRILLTIFYTVVYVSAYRYGKKLQEDMLMQRFITPSSKGWTKEELELDQQLTMQHMTPEVMDALHQEALEDDTYEMDLIHEEAQWDDGVWQTLREKMDLIHLEALEDNK